MRKKIKYVITLDGDIIKSVKEAVSIPVIGNGNIIDEDT